MIGLLLLLTLVALLDIQTMSRSRAIERMFGRNVTKVDRVRDSIVASMENVDDSFLSNATETPIYMEDNRTTTSAPSSSSSSTSLSPPFEVFLIPNEPLYETQSMVEEAIGPAVLQNPERNPLRNCSASVQFRLILPSDASSWVLQSMMAVVNDNATFVIPKTYGGDELYVEWQSSSTAEVAVAHVTDRNDGTYTLEFVRPPIQQPSQFAAGADVRGRLTIYYDYCCWIGGMFAPEKNDYTRAGEVHTFVSHEHIPRPYMRDFVPPNQDHAIDFSKYDSVITFGDSLLQQFSRRFSMGKFWNPKLYFKTNVCQCLSDPVADVDSLLHKFHSWHGAAVRQVANSSQRVAVVTGSAVWDAMRGCVRPGFANHTVAIRSFLASLQAHYPHLDVYWKSPSAVLLHRRGALTELTNQSELLQNARYMSDAIPRQLYALQKELMQELAIPFLDLWEAYYLSGPFTIPGDGRHYLDEISFLLLSYFWPGLSNGPPRAPGNHPAKKSINPSNAS